MSVIKPQINALLDETENNPFLLCSIASKRACDINSMLHGQHLRVLAAEEIDDITTALSSKDTISIALNELIDGTLSYDKESFDEDLKNTDEITF